MSRPLPTDLRPPRNVFVALLVVALLQLGYGALYLPDIMASHFDAAGRANGWQSRSAFLLLSAFILALVSLAFALMPRMFRGVPVGLVSLPQRDYWLAPERRDQTFAFIARSMLWFGCATLALLVAVTHLVLRVNLGLEPRLPSAWMFGLLAVYVGFTLVWLLRFVRRFWHPPV
jgi:uncharacterized membrane protein